MEEKLKNILEQADKSAPSIKFSKETISPAIHHRHAVRKLTYAVCGAAAVLVITASILIVTIRPGKPSMSPQQIASLEQQIKELNIRADATLKLVREVLDRQNKIDEIQKLNAQLASYGDPLQEIKEKVDEAALMTFLHADRLYNELNQKESAVDSYKSVIKYFPDTPSAEMAKQKLIEIEKTKINSNIEI